MAYNPTQWRDRVVERPRTYSLQDNGDGTYTLLPMPGNIIEPGTPVNAGNMNKIEQGIADTSQGLEQHINANTGVHGATPNATPSRIVMRDGNGRAAVSNPVNNDHIANKQYVDDAADAAEQAAKAWANAENVTVISPIAADVPGSEYPYGVTMFNFINVHGYPVDQGTALNINDPNPYRFAQIITYSTQNNTFAGETYIRIWRQDSGWSPFRKIWDSNNLPNPAQTDVANAFTQNQVIDKNIPLLLVRSRHTTGHVAGMQMQDAGGNDKWVAGFSPSVGTYSVYDYEAGHTALMIEPGAGGKMLFRGHEVWTNGNQGNPNNLNTSSKQIVGAINELFSTVSDGKQAIRDAIADAGGIPPSGSPDQYTHQDLAAAISTVRKHAKGSTPAQTNVQIRGINFDANVLTGDYQTSDDGFVAFTIIYFPEAGGFSRLFVNKSSTTAADPIITKVSGGFNITLDRPAGTSFDWEAWGGRP